MDLITYLTSENNPFRKSIIAGKLYGKGHSSTTKFRSKLFGIQNRRFNQEEKEQILNELKKFAEEINKLKA